MENSVCLLGTELLFNCFFACFFVSVGDNKKNGKFIVSTLFNINFITYT